jgi:hypothetical protein
VQRGSSDPAQKGTPQGAAFTASAHRSRRGPTAVALATIAFLGVALLTKQATSVDSAPVASLAAEASPGAAVSPSAIESSRPTASSTSGPPARDPTAKPHPTFVAVPVKAGTTRLSLPGSTPVSVTVALPHGWERASPAMYVTPKTTAPVGMSISVWNVQHVNLFPCRWTTPAFTDELFDHTAQGQAQALSAWWGQDPNAPFSSNATIAPIATRPRPTSIQGYPAWYVELLVPSVFDFTQCDGGQLVLWQTANGDVRYALGPGELDRLWVVDVLGTPIVIDAESPLMASSADEAALQGVIDSIAIKP